jgi:hypothetical protein
MLRNHPRNPLLILVFTAIGAGIRYCLFAFIFIIRGEKSRKNFYDYSNGFKQITYNLLFVFFLIIGLLTLIAYYDIKSKGH